MPGSSKKISRLEKEAVLRAKDSEYRREQSSYLLTNDNDDEEAFENERHRRFTKIRQAHQIQREIGFQVGMIDQMKERREQEEMKKKLAETRKFIASLPPPTKAPPSAPSIPLPKAPRTLRSVEIREKYGSQKQNSEGK